MKSGLNIRMMALFLFGMSAGLSSCDQNSPYETPIVLSAAQVAEQTPILLYMLEEEKLARDVYIALYQHWGLRNFNNISSSEQTHINAIVNLLKERAIDYSILPLGQFNDAHLQELYAQLIASGKESASRALFVGATIEDLDIVDLQNYMVQIEDESILRVFNNLKCGSGNHLRAYVSKYEAYGTDYAPQFISQEDYDLILSGSNGPCR